jgi:hypothetical protein
MIGKTIIRQQNVATPFSTKKFPLVKSDDVIVGSKTLNEVNFLAIRTRYPIIGNNILLYEESVSLSTTGVRFGVTRPAQVPLATVPLIFSYMNGSVQSGIQAIFFILTIEGIEQKVFFDTGRTDLLTATSQFIPRDPIRRRKIDIRFNAMGEWGLSHYTHYETKLHLGSEYIEHKFRHVVNDRSVNAPFIMGSSILNHFDITISVGDKQALFFRKGSFDFGGTIV